MLCILPDQFADNKATRDMTNYNIPDIPKIVSARVLLEQIVVLSSHTIALERMSVPYESLEAIWIYAMDAWKYR